MIAEPGNSTWRRPVFVLGEILLTISVLLAGFVFYQTVWTNRAAAEKQHEASDALIHAWDDGENPRSRGGANASPVAFARLFIPEFGRDYQYAILSDVRDADLEAGPGHYPSSQMPGEPGNFALAGHRVGRGSPFNDIDLLQTCSPIVIETADQWLEYRVLPTTADAPLDCFPTETQQRLRTDYAEVSGSSIVLPNAVEVLDPIPGAATRPNPGQLPLLTLTTCHPQFSAAERLIVHAALVATTPKAGGQIPAVLEES